MRKGTRIDERQRLLTSPAEHEGIAALETENAKPLARQPDEPRGDVALPRARLAAALACIFKFRMRIGEAEHGFIDQRVINDDIGLAEGVERMECEQARIPRSRPHEPDPARLKGWQGETGQGPQARRPRGVQPYDPVVTHITYICWYLFLSWKIACKYELVPTK